MEVNHHQREKVSTKEGEHDQEQDVSGHFSDKVKGLWHNAPSEEKHEQQEHHQIWKSSNNSETAGSESQERKDEGWREKLRALAGTPNKEEKKQVERGWLKEKLNEMAGGGAKSELDEDKLDKTVDFVQQYILHEGDQSNESALEQMKDEQISDAIRMAFQQVSGHELPVHDK
ncbi:hypothetical protein C8Q75DRAFT_252991 [Abortiporus biennis]|nr:hypothetical protein C8Q75DRAFT_252991 [Abortiporus biennis]